jgi:hypothetical protein
VSSRQVTIFTCDACNKQLEKNPDDSPNYWYFVGQWDGGEGGGTYTVRGDYCSLACLNIGSQLSINRANKRTAQPE